MNSQAGQGMPRLAVFGMLVWSLSAEAGECRLPSHSSPLRSEKPASGLLRWTIDTGG